MFENQLLPFPLPPPPPPPPKKKKKKKKDTSENTQILHLIQFLYNAKTYSKRPGHYRYTNPFPSL